MFDRRQRQTEALGASAARVAGAPSGVEHGENLRRFILFHDKRHPLEMGKREVGAFLTHLAVEGNVSSSAQNQALSALLFLYRHVLEKEFGWLEDVVRAKTDKHVPEVFSHQEALAVLANLNGVNWLIGKHLIRAAKCVAVITFMHPPSREL